jgi:hypothetical protein
MEETGTADRVVDYFVGIDVAKRQLDVHMPASGHTFSVPRRSDPKPGCGRDARLKAEAAEGGGA